MLVRYLSVTPWIVSLNAPPPTPPPTLLWTAQAPRDSELDLPLQNDQLTLLLAWSQVTIEGQTQLSLLSTGHISLLPVLLIKWRR